MSDTDTPSLTHLRAKKAHAVRYGNQPAADEADRDLRAAKLRKAIIAAVDAAPPLTEEQRALLAPSGGDQRAA